VTLRHCREGLTLGKTLSKTISLEQEDGVEVSGGPSRPKLFHDSVGLYSFRQH